MGVLSDHHESEHFSYSRTWDEIEVMLEKAEKLMHYHEVMCIDGALTKKQRVIHARNFKALQGVIKTLRWTLGDKNIIHPLE
jgi:hypothetical protein